MNMRDAQLAARAAADREYGNKYFLERGVTQSTAQLMSRIYKTDDRRHDGRDQGRDGVTEDGRDGVKVSVAQEWSPKQFCPRPRAEGTQFSPRTRAAGKAESRTQPRDDDVHAQVHRHDDGDGTDIFAKRDRGSCVSRTKPVTVRKTNAAPQPSQNERDSFTDLVRRACL